MIKIVSAAFLSITVSALPALAVEMHCHVNKALQADLNDMQKKIGGTNYNFKVKDTFQGVPESVSSKDYNNSVNVKFGTEKTTKKDLNVQVRPRKSDDCLNGIYNDSKKLIWGGAYCDIDNHQKASSVTLRAMDDQPGLYSAAGSANTTKRKNTFIALYSKQANEFILAGVCVEN